MKKWLLVLIFGIICFSAKSQLNNHPITNYTPREYGQNHPSYIMSITLDDKGLIYAGTAYGILQFDGSQWQFIRVKIGSYVTSMCYHNDTVFVGCQGDFGYLESDAQGKYVFKSLLDIVPKYHKDFSTIWRVLPYQNGVVFQAEEKFFLYDNQSIESITPETSFHLGFVSNDRLYVREKEKGLKFLSTSSLKNIEGSDDFKLYGIFQILPINAQKEVVLTREAGVWFIENNRMYPAQVPANTQKLLEQADIQNAIRTQAGEIAIASLKEGVIVLDTMLNIVNQYTIENGLISSEVTDLSEDSQGHLWVATKNGVSRIQHSMPISIFNQLHGLYGKAQTVENFSNKLIVGTTDDLFIYRPDGIKHFQNLGHIRSSIWKIEETPNKLWIGAENGLWLYSNSSMKRVSFSQTLAVHYIPTYNWVVSSGSKGTYIYHATSEELVFALPDVNPDAYEISSKFTTSENLEVWIGSKTQGVWQLEFSKKSLVNQTNYWGLEDGLNQDWVWPFKVNGDVLFGSHTGVLRFITAKELFGMEDDDIPEYLQRGIFALSDFPKGSPNKAITAFAIHDTLAFMGMNDETHVISLSDSTSSPNILKPIEMGRFNAFSTHESRLMVAADDGLAIVDIPSILNYSSAIPSLAIRSISVDSDSIIWHGDRSFPPHFTVNYQHNHLQIRVTSTYRENDLSAKFFWRIDGLKSDKFKEAENGIISLSNLWEGNYTISVFAQNIQEENSDLISFSFKILPPWYRTAWAYLAYIFMLFSAILLLIRMNTKRLREQNRRLEEVVDKRTREVVEQKEQIQLQKDKIEEILVDIQASISYAQRIQMAMLPSHNLIQKMFPKHFIMFYPRDIVSGDFYWALKIDDTAIITVADCTGHGVPGAFMSMLGISLLNEIVGRLSITSPNIILDELREGVIQALKQNLDAYTQKDGMDMSLIAINLKTLECQWAGANNPLYIFRSKQIDTPLASSDPDKQKITDAETGTLMELKQDRMPVAIHIKLQPFTSQTIQLQKGDRLFLFTDGIVDQFGGPNYKKFMSKQLRSLIVDTSHLNIEEQGDTIKESFDTWINQNGETIPQIDDVTLIGLEV